MDASEPGIREQFVRATDEWLRRLRRGEAPAEADATHPRHVVNLGHRISDTLPGDLAHRLETFVDEFWAVCQGRWPDRPGEAPAAPGPDRLAVLARQWRRLRQDLDVE